MQNQYFSELLPTLAERAKQSVISGLGFSSAPLRRHLSDVFGKPYGPKGSFLADPTFEAVFGWKKGEQTMESLAALGILTPELVDAMDDPPAELRNDYRFARTLRPYEHQIEAWKRLGTENPRSLIVASGTGSGKTECFMVPILDSLVRERKTKATKLIGVRALFLYPLNALINSQRDRFRAWTHRFGGDIRFCLYNGNTPEKPEPSAQQRAVPNEILDRTTLRNEPPPLLVTNATMLEYMLVRTADAPIVDKSRGKLKWVVLDEAHTYIGSQAAEAALLIRRVLLAFGVKPDEVRFVATSATIGDPKGEAGTKLRRFLAEVAGVSLDRVDLVAGLRDIPSLPEFSELTDESFNEISSIEAENELSPSRYQALARNRTARQLRSHFVGDPASPPVSRLSAAATAIGLRSESDNESQAKRNHADALAWIDLLSRTRTVADDGEEHSFLPVRAHLFHRLLSGIWACADRNCRLRRETALDDAEWPFGQIYFEPRKHCGCGSPVYDLVRCSDCASVMLRADIRNGVVTGVQSSMNAVPDDAFELEDQIDDDAAEAGEMNLVATGDSSLIIVNRNLDHTDPLLIERSTRSLVDSGSDTLEVLAYEDAGGDLKCPVCYRGDSAVSTAFIPSRITTQFMINQILPTMLEFAPDADAPADLPCRGRRLLSFSDSRQGTARTAALLQQNSERNRVRSLVYHVLLSASEDAASASETEQLKSEIRALEAVLENVPPETKAVIQADIDNRRRKLIGSGDAAIMGFDELAQRIANEGSDFNLMLAQYRRHARETFGGAGGGIELARIFLLREFGRRPKFSNSLETMGMVSVVYPALEKIREVPGQVQEATGFTLAEWKSFLKLLVDFGVRGRGAVDFKESWRNWLGMSFPMKKLVAADTDDLGKRQIRWPKVRTSGDRSKLVRMLALSLGCDIATSEGEDRIDIVLLNAWTSLKDVRVLRQTSSEGFSLDLASIAFKPLSNGFICPYTRRILDTVLRDVSPYTPRGLNSGIARCEPIEIPVYDKPFSATTDEIERVRVARKWIEENTGIDILRLEHGVWSDLNDRIVEMAPYYTTAEHSAQQDSKTLQRYEGEFKKGTINLLSCSTTMEMGIDIGGINMVAMNNVPPHPANYLQRAGRAGRRRESRSLAVTLCKNNPHDQNVFTNTRWAFDTTLPAPRVSLDSAVIVQRHINSFLLAEFLRESVPPASADSVRLTCGMFFQGTPEPLANRFAAWCRAFGEPVRDDRIRDGLRELVRHSLLDFRNQTQILDASATTLEEIRANWHEEWEQIESDRQTMIGEDAKSIALKAVEMKQKRLADEYLLRELATRGFLPGYGFPTNIAPFDNMNVVRFKAERTDSSREDNRFRRRELPSRGLTAALREYAPGSDVVIDGLVYKSSGVTLNWHIPADQGEVNEIQSLKFAWRCTACGASGSTHGLANASQCEECGEDIQRRFIREFLEPSGFAVDFYEEPSNDITRRAYVPVEDPWIDAKGHWFPLSNPHLGRFRRTTRGHIFNQSRGVHGLGYALCLDCGRAEPMRDPDELPGVFQEPHRKLRRAKDESPFCNGSFNSWKIKRSLTLGHDNWTDIVEIQLRDLDGFWLNDDVTALTLAVVLRDSLADMLGVEANELGCAVKPSRGENGAKCQSIIIFDHYGAGYSSSTGRFLGDIFRKAAERLDCPSDCDAACPACVLDYDQRFAAENLDRKKALEFLSESWLAKMKLPDEFAFFGTDSSLEHLRIEESIWLAASEGTISRLRFWPRGEAKEWDIPISPLRELAYRLAGHNIDVEIVVSAEELSSMNDDDRVALAALGGHPRIAILSSKEAPVIECGILAAEAAGTETLRWAWSDAYCNVFNERWGATDGVLVKSQHSAWSTVETAPIAAKELLPPQKMSGDTELEIANELDGPVNTFGSRFLDFLARKAPQFAEFARSLDAVASVRYCDRYVRSPLGVALVLSVVRALRKNFECSSLNPVFEIITTDHPAQNESSYRVWQDWREMAERDEVLRSIFENESVSFALSSLSRKDCPHARSLEIRLVSGRTATIRLDQGFGFWQISESAMHHQKKFEFFRPVIDQANTIRSMSFSVTGGSIPSLMFIKTDDG